MSRSRSRTRFNSSVAVERHPQRFKLLEKLYPGSHAQASLLSWDLATEKWVDESIMTTELYDIQGEQRDDGTTDGLNYGLPCEVIQAIANPQTGRFETIGSQGLIRYVVLQEPLYACSSAVAQIYAYCEDSGRRKAKNCFERVYDHFCDASMFSGAGRGSLCLAQYFPDSNRFEVIRVIAEPNDSEAPATTTTSDFEYYPNPSCTGTCKFTANASLQWVPDLSNSCAAYHTTTTAGGTTTAPATTTTAAPTTTTDDCGCNETFESATTTTVAVSTTTAAATTTTADTCQCAWPTFCPTSDGQCTYTNCVEYPNTPPFCVVNTTTTVGATTSTAAATTTTCDCNNTNPPTGCSLGCYWAVVPLPGGTYGPKKVFDGCSSSCPCDPPSSGPSLCVPAYTPCVLPQPTTTTQQLLFCFGYCEFICVPGLGWVLGERQCRYNTMCVCVPPSSPCASASCVPFRTPCVRPPTGTTIPGTTTTSPYTDCQLYCFGQTTTSTVAATTTTTQPTCDSGVCVWKADATATFWETIVLDTCPSLCPCAYPPIAPTESCEVYEYGCYAVATTTTAAPTTTTTAAPTTTTAGPTTTTAAPTTTTSSTTTTTTTTSSTTTTTAAPVGCCCRMPGATNYISDYYTCINSQVPGVWQGEGTTCGEYDDPCGTTTTTGA